MSDIYARGGHAFNMGNCGKRATLRGWPRRMADWMNDSGLLAPVATAGK